MNSITKKINKLEAMIDEELADQPLIEESTIKNDIRSFRLLVFVFVIVSYLSFTLLVFENISLIDKHEQDYYLSTYSGHVYKVENCDKKTCSATGLIEE